MRSSPLFLVSWQRGLDLAELMNNSTTKENLFARAYIAFESVEILLDFCKAYDGHTFIDANSTHYRAAVEFAPFQRWADPTKKKKIDARSGTIDKGFVLLDSIRFRLSVVFRGVEGSTGRFND